MPIRLLPIQTTRPISFDPSVDIWGMWPPEEHLIEGPGPAPLSPAEVHAYLIQYLEDPPRLHALALWDGLTVADLPQIIALSRPSSEPSPAPRTWIGCFGPPQPTPCGPPDDWPPGWVRSFTLFMESPLLFTGPVDARGVALLRAQLGPFDILARSNPEESGAPEAARTPTDPETTSP